jgi:colicin import membrane protein
MRTGLTISCAGHAAVLVLSVLTFVGRPHPVESTEALPIDIVSNSDFSKMTSGNKVAPPVEKPKPVAEKVADPTPVEDISAKIAKREIKPTGEVPPVPEVKPPEPKAKKQASPPSQPPVDPIGDLVKKDDAKPVPKKPDPKPPAPKKPVPQDSRAFTSMIETALQDKQDPQRFASAGNEVSSIPAVGTSKSSDDKVSQSEIAAMQAKILHLWVVPVGSKEHDFKFEIEIHLKRDGTLSAPPEVSTAGDSPLVVAAKESAVRAIYQGQPYTMLRPEHYEVWNDMWVDFHPVLTDAY